MKLAGGFWITLTIMVLLFILPTILTFGAPTYDGQRSYGFPLQFYSNGGRCYSTDNETGTFCTSFSYMNLIIDMFVLVGIPFIVNFIITKVEK